MSETIFLNFIYVFYKVKDAVENFMGATHMFLHWQDQFLFYKVHSNRFKLRNNFTTICTNHHKNIIKNSYFQEGDMPSNVRVDTSLFQYKVV